LRLDDLLKISKEGSYVKQFGPRKPLRATDHIGVFSSFFRGPEFKPTSFSFNNFQIEGEALFAHPDGVYKEYRALKQDDRRLQALLRRWDFSSLAGRADTKEERSRIGLREHRVLSYVQENNEELYGSLFQPLAFPTRDNVDADFCEFVPPSATAVKTISVRQSLQRRSVSRREAGPRQDLYLALRRSPRSRRGT
jgi:hypothetical protein